MTILDVKEVARRPMVVDCLSVITSRYENRGLIRPCADTESAVGRLTHLDAFALDSVAHVSSSLSSQHARASAVRGALSR